MTESEARENGYVDVKDYEGHYMVDARGNVFSLKRNRVMTPCKSNNGYLQVHLTKDGKMKSFKIHRLVAMAFIPNPYNLPQVNHKDEDKCNNHVDNLEWCTQSYNLNYNDGQKRRAKSRNYEDISRKRSNSQSKEVTQYDFDGSIIAVWKNAYVAEKHGYNRGMINQCCIGNKKSHRGYIWKYTNSMEKQIPKKPRNERSSVPLSRTSVRFVDWYKCGKCNFDLSKQFVCCPYCQSVIDWSDVD